MRHAVRENAVVPVLIVVALGNAVVWLALLGYQILNPAVPSGLVIQTLSATQHLEIALKSLIVGASWVCSYFAVKHLLVTIASPIRATSPMWTVFGALVLLREHPTTVQLMGVTVTIVGVLGLSWVGRFEGLRFFRDRWLGLMFISTLLSAGSVLYDKYLLTTAAFSSSTVQAWFSFYLAALFLAMGAVWWRNKGRDEPFQWRWSIPLISVSLLVGDFIYFEVLRDRESLVVLVTTVRRSSTLVAFFGAWCIFREVNGRQKLPAVLAVLLGIALIALG